MPTTSTSTASSANPAKPDSADAGRKAPSGEPNARGRTAKRLGIFAAALIVAGGAAYGIDQAVSGGGPSENPNLPKAHGAGAPAQPGALTSTYLATASNAIVSIDLVKAAGNSGAYTGGATALAQIGGSKSRSDAFIGFTVAATLSGDVLEIGFNGGPKSRVTYKNGSFKVEFPIPYGSNQLMYFKQSNVQAVGKAQQQFRAFLTTLPGS